MVSRSSRCSRSHDVRICRNGRSQVTRPCAVDGDPFGHLDAELAGAGAAGLQHLQQLRVRGDAGAAADELDRRALIDVGLPADLTQECGAEQPRHRAADDNGAPRFTA